MKKENKTLRTNSQVSTPGKFSKQSRCLSGLCKNRSATGFLLAGFLFLLVVGCNQEDSRSKGEGTFLSISSVSMAGTGTKSSTMIETNGVSLGVFRLLSKSYIAQSNAHYTYSTSTPGWSATSPIMLNTAAASVCAYYPYGAAGITSSTDPTTVTLTSQKYDAAQDLCYATNVNTPSVSFPTAAFAMQRAYTQFTFTITRDPLCIGTGNVSNISISNAGILFTASFDLTDGTFNSTIPGEVSFNPGIASIVSGTPATTSVLMVPVTTTMTGNLDLLFTVDGKAMTASIPVSTSGLTSLVAGSNYNIPVTISASSVAVGSVSTVDWSSLPVSVPIFMTPPQPESNCYIVATNSSITIPVSRANTGNAANFSSSTMPWTTGLLWTDVANPLSSFGTIASITGVSTNSTSGYISITTGSATGNAVVYVMNSASNICWSWHIWVTRYDPSATNISYNSLTWMDRNLGATNNTMNDVGCMGLNYQWGRKDPFPGPTTVNGATEKTLYGAVTSVTKTTVAASPNLVNSIQNPATIYGGTSTNNYDWYALAASTQNNALWGSTKTVYDPCPTGWKVSSNGAWASGLSGTWSSHGYTFTAAGWYEASGCRSGASASFDAVGTNGYYWSSTVYSTNAYHLTFLNGTVTPSYSSYRACSFNVRCVKE